MIVLSKQFPHEGQQFKMYVKYDEVKKLPIEVKSIVLHTHGNCYPVGNIMTKFFGEAVEKLIKETNWEKVYEEYKNKPILSDLIHPVMEMALRPFVVTGGEVREIYN